MHFFWAGILAHLVESEPDLPAIERAEPPRPTKVADVFALREQATADLLDQLAIRDDAERCGSWWPADQTVGFTRRMQTYEATMHRVDAELAAGLPVGPFADDVATGAVDHAVDVMWGWMPAYAVYQPNGIVEFVATDTGGRWLVEVGSWNAPAQASCGPVDGSKAARATSGEPVATFRAPLGDLALWAWTRGGAVQTEGNPQTPADLDAVVSEGMQ